MFELNLEQKSHLEKVIEKFPQIKEIADKFNQGQVRWTIAAGTAVYIYCGGDENLLDDVDIWVASESKEKVAEIFDQLWWPQSSERHQAENITLGVFDIFTNCKKIREGKQLMDYQWTPLSEEHLREETVNGVSYKIIAPEDVIVLKKTNARPKDEIDIGSVNKIGIDNDYLEKRFKECNLTSIIS